MKKLLLLGLVLSLLALPGSATWSIVVVNTRTREVAVASATCIKDELLERFVPVIVVGRGAGASQAWVAGNAMNKIRMWDGFHAGLTPQEILDDILDNDWSPGYRQFGIAGFNGPSVTFSGRHCGEGVSNVIGQDGDVWYAIQGNVLTGEAVGFAAEQALLATDGDVGQKIMAAMEAARSYGGDGRCSCNGVDPTKCGSPPPDFDKSAHCGFVFVARIGDGDGACNSSVGCANGEYYLQITTTGDVNDPDPVLVLQDLYDTWRAGLVGRPDHILSTAGVPVHSLPADGVAGTEVTVELVDVDGTPLGIGGATVEVTVEDEAVVTAGPVVDHGDGTYSFPVTAGLTPGIARFIVTADDRVVRATLYPFPEVRVDPVMPLHAGRDVVSMVEGARVPFTLNVPEAAGGYYLVLASVSGTDPGMPIGDLVLPLNPDDLVIRSFRHANNDRFVHTLGHLDGAGRAEAAFDAPAGLLNNLVGLRMDWAALTWDAGWGVTNPAGFDVRF